MAARPMDIKGRLVTLRAPEPADVPLLNQWANDPELWQWLAGWHFPYSLQSTDAWVKDRETDARHQVWCMDAPGVGLLGTGSLEAIDWKNRSAVLGMMIGSPAARGKGYALDATHAILRFAFDELGLNRIEGHILAYNERSLGLYEGKVGFRREGVRREAYHKGGRFHDAVIVGMTETDYRERVAASGYWKQ